MAGNFDAKLSGLAAEIVRDAVIDLDEINFAMAAAWQLDVLGGTGAFSAVTGSFPALTGSFPALTGSFAALTGSFPAIGSGSDEVSLKQLFGLGDRLAPVRLPPSAELARQARSAPLMAKLEALASWLGRGRLVDPEDELSDADADEAARWIRVPRGYLPYLWEYALTTGWFELHDEPGGNQAWAGLGDTARRWAEGDDSGALHVWSVVFAAVLAQALEVATSWDPRSARKLNLQGQGVVVGMTLFVDRRAGLSSSDVAQVLMGRAAGKRPSSRARRTWDGWVRKHGDPARLLLSELAALNAVTVPGRDSDPVWLTPVALWALREQVRRDGVKVPVLPAKLGDMTAAHMVAISEGVSEDEFGADFAAWVRGKGPDKAARELLAFAAFNSPQPRLAAVQLVRSIGPAVYRAWRDAMQRPELRGYARIALSAMVADLPESTLPLVLDPDPEDLTWVAADLMSLACGEQDPDPDDVAEQLREAVPEGDEAWVFDLMSRGSHPQVVRLLTALGRYHPDRRIAKDARKAARRAARGSDDRMPAGVTGR